MKEEMDGNESFGEEQDIGEERIKNKMKMLCSLGLLVLSLSLSLSHTLSHPPSLPLYISSNIRLERDVHDIRQAIHTSIAHWNASLQVQAHV